MTGLFWLYFGRGKVYSAAHENENDQKMNPITFNNSLLVLEQTAPDKHLKAKLRAMAESPLIKWSEPTDADWNHADFPEVFFENKCPRLPFKMFRVDGFYHYKGDGFSKFKAWLVQNGIHEKNPGYTVVIEPQSDENGDLVSQGIKPFLLITNFRAIDREPELGKIKWTYQCFDIKSRKVYNKEVSTEVMASVCFEWVCKLCIDFYNPHLFLCKTHPPIPQGKSVAWQKAREHFVLLHKSHSANKAEAVGQKVIEDGGTVDRIAHSRRAHFRLLRSPRFRHKQGARVWVKSAWCGPKEWSDRSGQIYKIIEKPQTASNQNETR